MRYVAIEICTVCSQMALINSAATASHYNYVQSTNVQKHVKRNLPLSGVQGHSIQINGCQ